MQSSCLTNHQLSSELDNIEKDKKIEISDTEDMLPAEFKADYDSKDKFSKLKMRFKTK